MSGFYLIFTIFYFLGINYTLSTEDSCRSRHRFSLTWHPNDMLLILRTKRNTEHYVYFCGGQHSIHVILINKFCLGDEWIFMFVEKKFISAIPVKHTFWTSLDFRREKTFTGYTSKCSLDEKKITYKGTSDKSCILKISLNNSCCILRGFLYNRHRVGSSDHMFITW